jgi:hypothetical protein
MTGSKELDEHAQVYANRRGIAIEEKLGFGQDGAVWQTSRETAVKVLERERTISANAMPIVD